MKNYKKIIIVVYVIIIALFAGAFGYKLFVKNNKAIEASTSRNDGTISKTDQRVFDEEDFLTDAQEEKLDTYIDKVYKDKKVDLAVVITDDIGSLTGKQYADKFYEEKGLGYEKANGTGAVLLIKTNKGLSTEGRVATISTTGGAREHLDGRAEAMVKDVCKKLKGSPLKDEDYYNASNTFITEVDNYMNVPSYMPYILTKWYVQLAIGTLISAIIVVCLVKKFGKKSDVDDRTYLQDNGLRKNYESDRFINKTVTTRHIEQSSEGSSDSSDGDHGGASSSF